MSHDDALTAIQAAAEAEAQADADRSESFATGTPAGETEPEVQPEEIAEPETPAEPELEPEDAPEDTFDGGQFNPDELPEELRPGWKQLQGAFTRKTQEVAGTLKEAEAFLSLGVDAETTGHAVDLYTRINDPSNWPALYEQLGQAMSQNGMEIPGAKASTPSQAAVAPSVDDAQLDALVEADPDLAPLVATLRAQRADLSRVDALQARLDAQETEALAAREEASQMRLHQQELARIEAEESQIREAFPSYKQDDVNMVYEMSTFHNGDLVKAQERLESYVQSRVTSALASKGRPKTAATKPAPILKSTAPAADVTLQELGEEAVEHMRALHRAGELDI